MTCDDMTTLQLLARLRAFTSRQLGAALQFRSLAALSMLIIPDIFHTASLSFESDLQASLFSEAHYSAIAGHDIYKMRTHTIDTLILLGFSA